MEQKRWADHPINDCYHYYSDGTICTQLFFEEQDFVKAMNIAAVLSFLYGIKILSINLMSNHFHMIIKGPREACLKFKIIFHRQLSRVIDAIEPRELRTSIEPITSEEELMTKIAYVQRNCIKAGFAHLPSAYPWGGGDIFFKPESSFDHGTRCGRHQRRTLMELLKTRIDIPEDWEYDSKGMILTKCWIDWKYVNELFATPNRYIAFMHQKTEVAASIRINCQSRLVEDFSMKELRKLANSIRERTFGRELKDCALKERLTIATKIWTTTYGYSLKSIARVLRIDYDVISAVLGDH